MRKNRKKKTKVKIEIREIDIKKREVENMWKDRQWEKSRIIIKRIQEYVLNIEWERIYTNDTITHTKFCYIYDPYTYITYSLDIPIP